MTPEEIKKYNNIEVQLIDGKWHHRYWADSEFTEWKKGIPRSMKKRDKATANLKKAIIEYRQQYVQNSQGMIIVQGADNDTITFDKPMGNYAVLIIDSNYITVQSGRE